MTATLMKGKPLAASILADVAQRVAKTVAASHRAPGLAVIRVGEDPASEVYVKKKEEACRSVGMQSLGKHLPSSATAEEVGRLIDLLNEDEKVDGILLQLPLPNGIDPIPLISQIAPEKDVDGFHPENVGLLLMGRPRVVPCTPKGIMALLKRHEVSIEGKRAVIVGRSNIVGKPMAALLLQAHATVTICHSRTRNLSAVTREADILVAAVGRPGFIGRDHVKQGAVVIDVGVNRVTDKDLVRRVVRRPRRLAAFDKRGAILLGDTCQDDLAPVVSAMTPVPGGIGPLTVAMLIENSFESFVRRERIAD